MDTSCRLGAADTLQAASQQLQALEEGGQVASSRLDTAETLETQDNLTSISSLHNRRSNSAQGFSLRSPMALPPG